MLELSGRTGVPQGQIPDGGECRRRRRVACGYMCGSGKGGGGRLLLNRMIQGTALTFLGDSLLPHWNLKGGRFSRELRRRIQESGGPCKSNFLRRLPFLTRTLSCSTTSGFAGSDLVPNRLDARRAR